MANVKYDRDALIPVILERIAEGESLRSICRDEGMPRHSTVLLWTNSDEKFAADYERAMQSRADVVFDEIFEIADNASGDYQRDRLRVDARKWALARMSPKKYGERIQNDINANVTISHEDALAQLDDIDA